MKKKPNTIVAFAGRRIDAIQAEIPRFPLTQIPVVHSQIEELFLRDHVHVLVCSAACGADLIALQVAQKLGLLYRIVLPFAPEQFRITSVMDRPSTEEWNWGILFDQVINIAQGNGELVVVNTPEDRQSAYQAVNSSIVNEAVQLGRFQPEAGPSQENTHVQAVIPWNGQARGARDLTLHFAEEARSRGLKVKEILTLP